jgi:4-hydroxybenzoate polyprenyltransferase
MKPASPYLALLRPPQWVKNFFCFGGLIFAGKAREPHALAEALETFAAFCAAASAVYIFNDIRDRTADSRHPQKRLRPLASGAVSPATATLLSIGCAFLALVLSAPLGLSVIAIIAGYIGLNAAYSCWLKQYALIDVMIIAAGFILRIFAGTEAVHVPASSWILLCTFFLSMFLGFAKRRAEMVSSNTASTQSRGVLAHYSTDLLDRYCLIFAALSIAAYALFTTSLPSHRALILTCPPVVYGILRYLWLVEHHQEHEQVEVVLYRDRPLQTAILIWAALYAAILYGGWQPNIQ